MSKIAERLAGKLQYVIRDHLIQYAPSQRHVLSIDGVKAITSALSDFEAQIRAEYEWNHDMSEAPRGHTKGEMLIFTDGERVGEGYFSLSHQVPYWARGGHRAEPIAWKRITTPETNHVG